MSASHAAKKRAERRMWSNHKKYLRRRGMKAYPPPKKYTMRPPEPKPVLPPVVIVKPKWTLWRFLKRLFGGGE